jgi:hypothetical protein
MPTSIAIASQGEQASAHLAGVQTSPRQG